MANRVSEALRKWALEQRAIAAHENTVRNLPTDLPPVLNRTYTSQADYEAEANELYLLNYVPRTTTSTAQSTLWGHTALRAVLTGGIGLLFGPSRSKAQFHVTYQRMASPSMAGF